MRIASAVTVLIGIAVIFFSVIPKRIGIFGEGVDQVLLHSVAYAALSLSVMIWWFKVARQIEWSALAAILIVGPVGVFIVS